MSRLRLALADPRLIFVALGLVGVMETAWMLPAFAGGGYPDWSTFTRAGQRLASGLPLYGTGAESFLYPPAMAVIWAAGLSAQVWLLLKVAILVALVPVLGRRLALPVLVLVALSTPLQYDLLTGNVTTLYVVAAVLFRRRPGWSGAVPLGLLLAIAAKPAYLPLLVICARRRPRDVARVLVVAIAATVAALPVVSAGAYLEYARSLIGWAGTSGDWLNGNVGPSRYGLAVPALLLGVAVILVALRTRDERRAAVLALGASLLVQPAYGFYYAALLIPAALDLWELDRVAAFGAALVAVPLAFRSPALSGLVFVVLALSRRERRAPDGREFGTSPVAPGL